MKGGCWLRILRFKFWKFAAEWDSIVPPGLEDLIIGCVCTEVGQSLVYFDRCRVLFLARYSLMYSYLGAILLT